MDTSTEPKFDPADEPQEPSNTPPTPAEVPSDKENTSSLADTLKDGAVDVGKGLLRASEGAVREAASTAKAVGIQLLPPGLRPSGGPQLSDLIAPTQTKFVTPEPQQAIGKIVAGLTQAVLAYGTGAGTFKAAGVVAKGLAGTVAKSAVGAGIAGDTENPRLSNLLLDNPWLAPIAHTIAQNPDDSVLVAKAKAMAEDVVTNVVAGQLVSGLRLGYLQIMGKGESASAKALEKEVIAGHEASVRPDPSTNGNIPGADELDKLNPVVNKQATKDTVKKAIQTKFADGATEFAARGMSEGEYKAILTSGKMQMGSNAEGQSVISAEKVNNNGMAMYGDGWAVVAKKGHWDESGLAGEVHLKPEINPKELSFVDPQGNVRSFDEAKAALSASKTEANGAAPLTKPITLKTPDGEPIVTLTPRKQAAFEQKMEDLIIKDHVEGTPKPEAGPNSKQGSMNTAHMDGPNVVLQGLRDLGDMTKTELQGKMPMERTWAQTEQLAQTLGENPDELKASLKTFNKSAEDIDAIALGARMYIQTKGAEMISAGRKAFISGDQAAKEQFDQIYTELAEVQAHLSSATNRLGRGLSSFNINAKPFDIEATKKMLANPEESKKLQRLMEATNGDPEKIAHILKIQQMSWLEKAVGTHNEYWTGLGLLSRAATQTINLGSTGLQAIMEPFSMIVGGVEQGIVGKGWEAAREGVGIYSGMRTAFMDSLHMAWQAAKTEQAIISQSGTVEQKTQYISSLTYNMNPDSFGGKFVDLMGNITRASFRGLTAGDEFFKQLSYRAKISATASREAVDMVKAGKMQQQDVAGYVAQKLQEALDSQGRATNPDALKYAEKASFVNDLKGSTWGDWTSVGELMARAASHPIIRGVILPFVKTPTNVTRTTFEYTPLIGQLRRQFATDVQAGGQKQAQAIGKLTIGSGMYAAAGMLAVEGRITGAPPPPGVITPPGYKPYSIIFTGMGENGGDLYLSYQRAQPFGDILGLTYDFAKSTGMLDDDTRDGLANSMSLALSKFMEHPWDTGTDAAIAVGASYGKSLISKTYFRNMTEFFSTFSGYNNESAVLRWFQNYTASHVPGVFAQLNSDDTIREVRSTLDAVMARIPGLSQTLPAKRDYLGRIQDIKVGYPWSIIQPLSASSTKPDLVMHELVRLSKSSGEVKFSEMPHTQVIAGKKQDLKTVKNDAGVTAYDRMNELMQTVKPLGRSLNFHDQLSHVMHSDRYQLGNEQANHLDGGPNTPGLRTTLVKVEEGAYRQAALDQVKNEYKAQLGIESAMKDKINTTVSRTKIRVGLQDKLLELNK